MSLDGSVIRVDPATGAGLPSNPLAGNSDANARRIIAHGLRNPFRFTFRPGTSELWIGDVGWNEYEEINRILNPSDAVVEDFGWPCYEGNPRQSGYDSANLSICENLLYANPSPDTKPFFQYHHNSKVVPGESCPTGSSSISGLSFEFAPTGSTFPAAYQGALFFSDYSRDCIWVIKKNGNPIPSPGSIDTFVAGAANPVMVEFGPGGDLFYVDLGDGTNGTIRRVHYNDTTAPAVLSTTPANGATGVAVGVSPTAVFSENMDASTLTTSTFTLVEQGTGTPLLATVSYDAPSRTATLDPTAALEPNAAYTATVKGGSGGAKDLGGNPLAGDFSWTFQTNRSPTPVIDTPASTLTWEVGESISFSGHATDPEQGTLPDSSLSWTLLLQHCPSNCHSHTIQSWPGVAGASFNAPDHEYPSYLELRLTATDAAGASASTTLRLDPLTVLLTFQTSPSGLQLSINGTSSATPFTRTVIQGSTNSLSATSPQVLNGTSYKFSAWSDGGEPTHNIVASTAVDTYTANYVIEPPRNSSVADFNGDGKTDISVYRPGEHRWYSSNGVTPFTFWGIDGDVAVPANYDGDADDDFAMWRPSEGIWYVNDDGVPPFTTWGIAGDIPVPGDYNDDGDDDFAVYRPSEGRWYVNDDGVTSFTTWGIPGPLSFTSDRPEPGDYNGDGKTDIAIFRPSEGIWYVNDGVTTMWGDGCDIQLPLPYSIRTLIPRDPACPGTNG